MKSSKLLDWLRRHKLDAAILTVLLITAGTVSAINMTGYPQRFEDEGTYISQAWAIQETGSLTHYTYWYDHPPLGWIQMSAHLMSTNALDRYDSAITAGREFMLIVHLATIVLLFALARRLRIGSIAAGIGTLAFALSPLAVEFSRYVLLDNVALPWFLGALFLALSPRKHIATAAGSAVCMAIAVLSKETFLMFLPVLIYGMWQTGDRRNLRYTLAAFGTTFVAISATYILFALLKNELLPGEGHVSLLGTFAWQVLGREGSGSIFDAASNTRGLIKYWLNIDYWLMLAGAIALPFAFLYRNLRVIALALLIGLVMLVLTGYLPYPYIIALLPLAALTFAGVLHYGIIVPLKSGTVARRLSAGIIAMIVAFLAGFVALDWHATLANTTSVDQDASSRQAVDWIDQNVPRDSRLVVESALWTDLQDVGFNQPDPIWLFKTETDPAVTEEIGGWRGIDYVVLNGPTIGIKNFDKDYPTVNQAIDNSNIIVELGRDNQKVIIYEVIK